MADPIEETKHKWEAMPFGSLMGWKIIEASEGHSKVSLELAPKLRSSGQRIHGGVIAALADMAFGSAMNSFSHLKHTYVTGQLRVNFLFNPSVGGTLLAETTVVHAGRRMGSVEITIKDSKGKLIATATAIGIPVSRV